MEFHAWIKQRKCWPDSVDACSCLKRKIYCEIFGRAGSGAEVKGAILGLTFIQTEPACSVVWCWTGKRGNGGKKGPRLFSAFLGCVCLLVWAHVHVYAQTYVQFVFILWVLKAFEHGSNKGSWHPVAPICTVPFNILECLQCGVSGVAAARQTMHNEGTSVMSRTYNHHHFLFIGALLESLSCRSVTQLAAHDVFLD